MQVILGPDRQPGDDAVVTSPPRRSDLHEPGGQQHGAEHHGHIHESRVESFALTAPFDTDRDRVRQFFSALDASVWRAKGFMRVDGGTILVQYSAGQLDITPAPRRTIHEVVFIGARMDRAGIESRFAALPH